MTIATSVMFSQVDNKMRKRWKPCVNFIAGPGADFLLFLPFKILNNVPDIFLVFLGPRK